MRYVTKAVEHDLCAALEHILLHRSRTSHQCRCGYRTVWGRIERGECPECDETIAVDQLEEGLLMKTRIVRISAELITRVLTEGTAACYAEKGLPSDAVLVGARVVSNSLELDFFSHDWAEDEDEYFIPTFRR